MTCQKIHSICFANSIHAKENFFCRKLHFFLVLCLWATKKWFSSPKKWNKYFVLPALDLAFAFGLFNEEEWWWECDRCDVKAFKWPYMANSAGEAAAAEAALALVVKFVLAVLGAAALKVDWCATAAAATAACPKEADAAAATPGIWRHLCLWMRRGNRQNRIITDDTDGIS